MPLPTDEKLLDLSDKILATFAKIFGEHPGIRPAHGKGTLLNGTFTPAAGASNLSVAPHFQQASTPVVVRFSDSTGLPNIPDTDPNSLPKGIAIRFVLGVHEHTDVIAHSADAFPARTGEEFLEFLEALASSDPANPAGSPLEAFLGTHPAALRFVQPKPFPSSFASEAYFGVSALKFINAAGESRFGRYRITPESGTEYIDESDLQSKDDDYLFAEIVDRIAARPVRFSLAVQLAEDGDVVDDATAGWPSHREVRELGTVQLTTPVVDAAAAEQKHIIFDPIPRVAGIEPSDDPLLELRAALYLISGRRRREA